MCSGRNRASRVFTVTLVLAALALPASALASDSRRAKANPFCVRGQTPQRKTIIVNMKAKPTIAEQVHLAGVMAQMLAAKQGRVIGAIAPSDFAMPLVIARLAEASKTKSVNGRVPSVDEQHLIRVLLAAQNVHHVAEGSMVGESSIVHVKELEAQAVILGHSDRRKWGRPGQLEKRGETDDLVNMKARLAQEHGLVPVICVGEDVRQSSLGRTLDLVLPQVERVTRGLDRKKVMIAYEPVWSIGSGVTPTAEEAQDVQSEIRSSLGLLGKSTRILYGGSFDADNGRAFLAQKDIDGALVATAAFNPQTLSQMIALAAEAYVE